MNIVAIDGISRTGKTTVGSQLATQLNYGHLSVGNIYRAIANWIGNNIDETVKSQEYLPTHVMRDIHIIDSYRISVAGTVIDLHSWNDSLNNILMRITSDINIRNLVREYVQQMCQNQSMVIDGRTVGTHIFPNAQMKLFFLRSYTQNNIIPLLNHTRIKEQEIMPISGLDKRDILDITRKVEPLRIAKDAKVIYAFDQSERDTVELVLEICRRL